MLFLSPFLCMGTMWANFHSAGIEPVLKDRLNNNCSGYAIDKAQFLSNVPLILSGPVLLFVFNLINS